MILRRSSAMLALALFAACADSGPLAPAGADSVEYFTVQRRVLNPDSTWTAWDLAASWAKEVRVHPEVWSVSGYTVRYRVRACNGAGCSAWVNTGVIRMAPPVAPASLAGAPLSATSSRVTWTDASSDEDGFVLHRRRRLDDGTWTALQQVAAPGRNVRAFTDTGLVAGVAYQYQVGACNAAGCAGGVLSPEMVIPLPPAPPTGTAAAAASATSARVTWTDASTGETSFTVARRLRNVDGTQGPLAVAGTVPAGSAAYLDGDLLPGRTYAYWVRACIGAVCSAWSPAARVTLPAG